MNITENQIRMMLATLFKSDKEGIEKWLATPLLAFQMKTPREMIESGQGSAVVQTLTRFLPNGRPNAVVDRGPEQPTSEAGTQLLMGASVKRK